MSSRTKKAAGQQQKQQAQHEHQNQINQQNAQQQEQQNQNRQQAQQREQQSQNKQQQAQYQQQRGQQMQRSQQQQREQQVQQQQVWQQHRSNNWDNDHRNWQQRGGYNGYRIPDNDFRGHYGPITVPHLQPSLQYQGGYPRFQYGGYWFGDGSVARLLVQRLV